jgi:hypothetical protein
MAAMPKIAYSHAAGPGGAVAVAGSDVVTALQGTLTEVVTVTPVTDAVMVPVPQDEAVDRVVDAWPELFVVALVGLTVIPRTPPTTKVAVAPETAPPLAVRNWSV